MGKRNPNGYGCVTRLKGKRSKPYMVRVTTYDMDGFARQTPIAYAETEEEANIILASYNNNPWDIRRDRVTFNELYQRWLEVKAPQLGNSLVKQINAAYKWCSRLYGMKYRQIKSYHMQSVIDACDKSVSTKACIKKLFYHLDNFAFELDIIDKMYSQIVTVPPAPETSKVPFTKEETDKLWKIQDEPYVDTVLIYLYTGFRLTELLDMKVEQVDMKNLTFKGGVKTAAGKNRIVPIHPRIQPLVKRLVDENNVYLFNYQGKKISQSNYYILWNDIMKKIDAVHTPHEARHTFRSRLDSAGGNKVCIDMLMGHKSASVGERTYTHKTLDELRATILLLK